MSNPMPYIGKFAWYELLTPDDESSASFYSDVIGWGTKEAGNEKIKYTVLTAGETGVAGMKILCEEAQKSGAKPGWIGYIHVEDVDAAAARVRELGGKILRAAEDIQIVRFAVVADPQGAAFMLFKPLVQEDCDQPVPSPQTPGLAGWRELHTSDWEKAFEFYSAMFGWTKADSVDMGPMGTYQVFAADSIPTGGMMNGMDKTRPPFWLYYFNVDDINAAAKRVKDKGGQVLHGPHQVPGGSWIVNCLDPQGIAFALVSCTGSTS
ncbi:MAG: Glyoxalase/bleomycin resistance protein/dioxygenase [Alphaproteobacteria bacterium]|nr:Glyoxalase/bleomycin resistance protein/dioxygenase [Alphaproteobacteria bacterium]